MPRGFIRKELSDSRKLRETPEVVDLFTCANWMTFCDIIQGYDDEVTEEFLMSLQPKSKILATLNFKGLTLKLTPRLISQVTDLPLGISWSKEESSLGQKEKKEFFLPEEQFSKDKNGVWRANLHPFWSEVDLQIMKYIAYEGWFNIVYGYHFRLLTELKHKMDLPSEKKNEHPIFPPIVIDGMWHKNEGMGLSSS